jgi:hypothetical protein
MFHGNSYFPWYDLNLYEVNSYNSARLLFILLNDFISEQKVLKKTL